MHLKISLLICLVAATSWAQTPAPSAAGNGKRAFTFEDMMKLKRLAEPVPSPDGKWVVFAATDVDLAANTKKTHLWIVPANGGEAHRLNSASENEEERPRFSPDGKKLIFTSKATDPTQIWMRDFDSASGALTDVARQVTSLSTGADGGIWSPDGKNIVFLSSVYPECKDDACNQQRDEALKKSKVKAKIFEHLLYRHWNAFTDFKRSHLFVVSAEADPTNFGVQVKDEIDATKQIAQNTWTKSVPNVGASRDLTPGDHDVPPFNLGGQDMYAVSPDGQEVAYTSNIDEVGATSTNNEIFLVPMNVGRVSYLPGSGTQVGNVRDAEPKKISTSPGSDNTPLYSPDGKWLAWRSMARAGFEADKDRLFIYDRASKQTRDLSKEWDRSTGSYAWRPDSKAILLSAEDHGESPIFEFPLDAKQPTELAKLHADDLVFGKDSELFFSRVSIAAPSEVGRLDLAKKGEPVAVTHVNDALLSQIEMPPLEPFTFKGAKDEDVQGFLIKPPSFDAAKKYPLKFLIHGGPQGGWGDSWSYRWNAELFAAIDSYVVVMINFHGSTGYGQAFTDSISGDWGGKPFEDLMKGLDYAEKTYPFIDKNSEAALGASYGGYMANWVLGHTDRFQCIVSHDGMFNTESAYGTTEELWFNEWEFKGPPWKNRELYRKFSPHLFADKFKTPTLVVHGQLDYRLDVSEGFQLFTTLQRLGVPSKMLYFPDEGHWVNKPQNSQLWYKTVNDWVDQWCKK
ncbi:MAG: prolyl oligopeptidase family serine peptidase [Chthoniobacterales bacterium]